MNPNELNVGDTVTKSPVGEGVITGFSQRGYPQVNYITVACLIRTDGVVCDPHGNYAKEQIEEVTGETK